MKLTKKVLKKVKENTRLKNLLALEFGKSVYTIERWIQDNDDNLTKAAALQIIKSEIGLKSDDEILESATV